jgi:hypothetical protein
MNDLSNATKNINSDAALERATADYATVGDLIKEAEASIRNDDKIIEEARETIKAAQDHKRMSRDYIRLQTARRRVFANAKHRLQMIDEGL